MQWGVGGGEMDVTVLFDCHVEYETEGDVEGAIQQNFLFLSFSYPFCKCLCLLFFMPDFCHLLSELPPP